jgi:hypothetical protein
MKFNSRIVWTLRARRSWRRFVVPTLPPGTQQPHALLWPCRGPLAETIVEVLYPEVFNHVTR